MKDLLHEIESFSVCTGETALDASKDTKMHVVPRACDPLLEEHAPCPRKEIWRSKQCEMLIKSDQQCTKCMSLGNGIVSQGKTMSAKRRMLLPAKTKAPASKTCPDRIKLTLQAQRLICAQLQKELNYMQAEILKSCIPIDHGMSKTS